MIFEQVSYNNLGNCYRLSNGDVELIITGDVGPRIIRFGFVGEDNEFAELDISAKIPGQGTWHIYGGHRFWHAPEHTIRTYYPDNNPVEIVQQEDFVRVTQPTEPTTGIQKELDIYLASDSPHVKVVHRMTNHNLWAVELAPWALSVMNTGGKCIIPLPPRGTHADNLLPANTLTMWAYTDMSDPRWTWGRKYIMLNQDVNNTNPQKIGAMVPAGWVAYARQGHLFIKTFDYVSGATYPDLGCSVETFTNELMLEVETVAPLIKLEPDAKVEHIENWRLYKDVPMPVNDSDVDSHILPYCTHP